MTTHPKEPNGGPAFPYNYTRQAYGAVRELVVSEGMTLRDAFALAALPELVAEAFRRNLESWDETAAHAYIIADAMLERRLK